MFRHSLKYNMLFYFILFQVMIIKINWQNVLFLVLVNYNNPVSDLWQQKHKEALKQHI